MRLLANREHSRKELERKLRSRSYAADDVEQVLDQLAAQGLQSDARYTEAYIHSRMQRGYGPLRIRVELKDRGISAALMADYLCDDPELWQNLLQTAHDRKYGSGRTTDRKEQAKRGRFLAYRGFSGEMISRFLFNNAF
ncbi:MAG: recombination regulator RecX [Candidatus Polarisedimenticolaceae bacterium]|nr:recombination regulator RecX [Candidatus Polarisedimenticolaceae bacterium]